jgi:hypothetical protein
MTPESIPGTLFSEELEEELTGSLVYQREPAYLEHDLFFTDLRDAA